MKKNIILNSLGGGYYIWYANQNNARFVLTLFFQLFLTVFNCKSIDAQNQCGFDEYSNSNNQFLEEMLLSNTQALPGMSNTINIPVVFHVVYQQEDPIGTNTNISDNLINSCLTKLNADFSNSIFNIQFCMAKRDPNGNLTTGIERINGSVVDGYDAFGLIININEYEVKTIGQSWPNTDYINIWIVNKITSNPSRVGLASFPNSTLEILDGIVIDYNYVDEDSDILTHEMGHFFGLYHTFEGSLNNECPENNSCDQDPNNNITEVCCRTQGDRCCDTPPHKLEFGCPQGTNLCDNTNYNQIVHNFMSYFDQICLNQFSGDQLERMKVILNKFRSTLMTSVVCQEPCNTVNAEYESEPVYYFDNGQGTLFHEFINTSLGNNLTSNWTFIDPAYNSSALNIKDYPAIISLPGKHTLCLNVSDGICADRTCKSFIAMAPTADCGETSFCNLVRNSNLSIYNVPNLPFHYPEHSFGLDFEKICNWYNFRGSPFFCSNTANGEILGAFCKQGFNSTEMVGISENIELISGETYEIVFDYYIQGTTNSSVDGIYFIGKENLFSNEDYDVLASMENVALDEIVEGFDSNAPCLEEEVIFRKAKIEFAYNYQSSHNFFAIGGLSDFGAVLFLKNVKLNKCIGFCGGEIGIESSRIDDCTYQFSAVTEDPVEGFTWEFDCEESVTGNSIITHSFLYPGAQNVCLTVSCDNSTSKICESITIPETCFSLNCDNIITNSIPVFKCGANDEEYLANISFNIPKGYTPCSNNPCFSGDVNVEDNSYLIDTSNPLHDVLIMALSITNAEIGQVFSFSLCGPNGGVLCYQYSINNVQECAVCIQNIAIATCTDLNFNDGIHNYTGVITLPITPPFEPCGYSSSQAGLSILNYNQNNGNTSINFNLSTTQQGNVPITAIICFMQNNIRICYNISIDIPEPCDPENCEEVTLNGIECSELLLDGTVNFNFSTALYRDYIGEGFTLCNEDGIIISDGIYNVSETTYNYTPNRFLLVGEYIISCDALNNGLEYLELELRFCNDEGQLKCLILNIPIECSACPRGGEGRLSRLNDLNDIPIHIYPNPADCRLNIILNSMILGSAEFDLLNTINEIVVQQKLKPGINAIDISYLAPGVYFMVYKNGNQPKWIEKIVITR